jgi:DNA-directed RNA polymerase specialized sigma24 family protein
MEPNNADGVTLLRALVALQIADRQERVSDAPARPVEVVLADAGLGLAEIAALTGRKYETVKTTIRRARTAEQRQKPKRESKVASKNAAAVTKDG